MFLRPVRKSTKKTVVNDVAEFRDRIRGKLFLADESRCGVCHVDKPDTRFLTSARQSILSESIALRRFVMSRGFASSRPYPGEGEAPDPPPHPVLFAKYRRAVTHSTPNPNNPIADRVDARACTHAHTNDSP